MRLLSLHISGDGAVLEVQSLNVAYGRAQVLFDVSMTVDEGEFVTLIGPNGAGKTTLLLTLSGILKPSSGMITFGGQSLGSLRPHQIVAKGLGHVPQGKELFPTMSVLENLELGAHHIRDHSEFSDRLGRVLGFFPRLEERSRQLAGTLSGGEQQMLAIARTLMGNPSVLLLDEPSAGLAPIVIDDLADIIVDLNRHGLTVLLVEQNAYLGLELAARAYVLESGRVVASGNADDVLESDLVRRAYLGL